MIANDWSGNIRGLKNIIERVIILSDKNITLEHLRFHNSSNSKEFRRNFMM